MRWLGYYKFWLQLNHLHLHQAQVFMENRITLVFMENPLVVPLEVPEFMAKLREQVILFLLLLVLLLINLV